MLVNVEMTFIYTDTLKGREALVPVLCLFLHHVKKATSALAPGRQVRAASALTATLVPDFLHG